MFEVPDRDRVALAIGDEVTVHEARE